MRRLDISTYGRREREGGQTERLVEKGKEKRIIGLPVRR